MIQSNDLNLQQISQIIDGSMIMQQLLSLYIEMPLK